MMDGNDGNSWTVLEPPRTGSFVKVTLGTFASVTDIRLVQDTDTAYTCSAATLYYLSGGVWETALTITAIPGGNSGYIALAAPVTAKEWKLVCSSSGGTQWWARMIGIYGSVTTDPGPGGGGGGSSPAPTAAPTPATASAPPRAGSSGVEKDAATGGSGGGTGAGNGHSGGGATGGGTGGGTSGGGGTGGPDGDGLPDDGGYVGKGFLGKTYTSDPESDLSTVGGCPTKGPLSGDIGKPLICLLALDQCEMPESSLDVPGWLSYVWCELRNLPRHIINAVLTLANVVIDLAIVAPIFPDRFMARVSKEYADHGMGGASGLFSAGSASMAAPGTMWLGGSGFQGPVDLWGSIQSVMAPARPVLGWLVYGAFAVWAWGMWRRHVMGQESEGLAMSTGDE